MLWSNSIILLCITSISFGKDLFMNLRNFDIIDQPKIRLKRSSTENKEIQINTKFKNFKVILNSNKHIFAKGFKAFNIDKIGNEEEVIIDPSHYYKGYISGVPYSSVSADFSNEDEINLNIDDGHDLYKIEPGSRYDDRYANKTIVYRLSDIVSDSTVKRQPPIKLQPSSMNFEEFIRSKRQDDYMSSGLLSGAFSFYPRDESQRKKYCTVVLVADYRFYKKFGNGNKFKTHRFLIEIMNNINQIYERTVYVDSNNQEYPGIVFIIKKIIVHKEPTNQPGHYNELKIGFQDSWHTNTLLQEFSKLDTGDVCLSHLFTYQSFSSGTLGLAYMASYKAFNLGGICSKTTLKEYFPGPINTNTGWSTYRDSAGNSLVSMSAYLVTAHELGHNVGSDHDPDTNVCSPPSEKGGKYIMYTHSIVGNERNNKKFSPCSIRTIGETLRRHAAKCLKSESEVRTEYCGNQRIEEGEECDVGRSNSNKCCNSNCKLHRGALCSPDNHQCCTEECQLSQRGTVCAETSPQHMCLGNAQCTGLSKHCPAPTKLSGPNCTEQGQCRDGVCQPFCQHFLQLEACICDKVSDSCHICCLDNTSSSDSPLCKPAHHFFKSRDTSPNTPKYHLTLNDGRPCLQGMCQKGICKQNRSNLIQRIWKIIDNFNTNLFVTLLLDNLVFVVIIISLIFWIPASLLANCYDKTPEIDDLRTIHK